MVTCEKCGDIIPLGTGCYQVRYGEFDENGFGAEEDVAYFCWGCGLERGNFSSTDA